MSCNLTEYSSTQHTEIISSFVWFKKNDFYAQRRSLLPMALSLVLPTLTLKINKKHTLLTVMTLLDGLRWSVGLDVIVPMQLSFIPR